MFSEVKAEREIYQHEKGMFSIYVVHHGWLTHLAAKKRNECMSVWMSVDLMMMMVKERLTEQVSEIWRLQLITLSRCRVDDTELKNLSEKR